MSVPGELEAPEAMEGGGGVPGGEKEVQTGEAPILLDPVHSWFLLLPPPLYNGAFLLLEMQSERIFFQTGTSRISGWGGGCRPNPAESFVRVGGDGEREVEGGESEDERSRKRERERSRRSRRERFAFALSGNFRLIRGGGRAGGKTKKGVERKRERGGEAGESGRNLPAAGARRGERGRERIPSRWRGGPGALFWRGRAMRKSPPGA